MSSLDELCEMLVGRREEFFVNDFGVNWRYYSDPHTATESMDGTLIVTGLTPEQAVNATLGPRTCRLVETEHEQEIAHEFGDGYFTYWSYDCDECGHENTEHGRFCAGCGRKVVDE